LIRQAPLNLATISAVVAFEYAQKLHPDLNPAAIALEVFYIAHQHPSTWSFDHIIRPFAQKW